VEGHVTFKSGRVPAGRYAAFRELTASLDRAFGRLSAFEADPRRLPRHALRVVLTFALLDKRRLALDSLPDYVDRIGIYRDFNAAFLRLPPAELAHWLVAELERAGAARREDGFLVPAGSEAG